MRYINIVFTLLFLLSAFLQLNDVDPVLWFSIYFAGALLCFLEVLGKGRRIFLWLATGFFLSYAFYLFISPDGVLSWYNEHQAENIAQSMKTEKPWIEETREFFGLIILCFAMLLNILFPRTKQTFNRSTAQK